MSSTRQLAAIMFTDIVGYTSLMGKDEQKAFKLLNQNRQIQKPIIEQHNGRWIKELGDGVLASFPTVSDAVYAAIKIQQESVSTEDLLLRIGIHLGDIVFEDDDVFGDGVNIASRIQALAPPGGIWISETVRNNVTNKSDIVTEFVKVERLKNVKEPVRIYKVHVVEGGTPAPLARKHSIIPGYHYDVFISYRQKDNKGERWVSEFAEMIRAELDATTKEDISIYFDENPHDGLMETHDVDESLKEKLKCLIFVPIISQTFCDTRSFAWQNEFIPFIQMASGDKFGLAIKLLNGNVASRVLPVRIHELEAADIKLLEDELKTKIRPVDFIYKSSGVNRPLRSSEDDPLKNVHKILYRDQINKTANAIKDIISGLKNFESHKASSSEFKPKPSPSISNTRQLSTNAKSIAVLPFVNTSKKEDEDYFSDGLTEHLIDLLTNVKGLKVASRASAFQLRGDKINTSFVGEKLSVGTIIEGTVHRQGENITVSVKATSIEKVIWSEAFDRNERDIFKLLQDMTITLAEKLNAVIREGERNLITKVPTSNIKAYELYLKGKYYWYLQGESLTKSLTCFKDAAALDPQFSLAYVGVADAHILLGYYNLTPFNEAIKKSKEAALKALEIDPSLVGAYTALAFIGLCYEWNWPDAEQNFSKVFAINPTQPTSHERYGRYLDQIVNNQEEAESEPLTTIPYFLNAYALLHRGRFEDAHKASHKAVEQDPNSFMAQRALGLSYLGMEKYDLAIEALLVAARLSNRHHWLLFELMGAYVLSGKQEEAIAIMEEAMAVSNVLPAKIYDSFFPSGM